LFLLVVQDAVVGIRGDYRDFEPQWDYETDLDNQSKYRRHIGEIVRVTLHDGGDNYLTALDGTTERLSRAEAISIICYGPLCECGRKPQECATHEDPTVQHGARWEE